MRTVYSQSGSAVPALEESLKEVSIVWFARKLNLGEHLPKDLLVPRNSSGSR